MDTTLPGAIAIHRLTGDYTALARALSEAKVYIFVPWENESKEFVSALRVITGHEDSNITFIPFFHHKDDAFYGLYYYQKRNLLEKTAKADVLQISLRSFFHYLVARELPAYYNPLGKTEQDKKLFNVEDISRIFKSEITPESSGPEISDSSLSMEEIDFRRARTVEEIATIFGTTKEKIESQIERLVKSGVIDPGYSEINGEDLFYAPIVIFYLGLYKNSQRGTEFRNWFNHQMELYYFNRENLVSEMMSLNEENRVVKSKLEISEKFKHKVKREYLKLKKRLEETEAEARQNTAYLEEKIALLKKAAERDNRRITGLYEEVVQLENDLMVSAEWCYPESLEETLVAGARLYSSKLVLTPKEPRIILTDAEVNHNHQLIAETVRMLKALALSLHPMKYKYGNFSERRFQEESGFEINIPISVVGYEPKLDFNSQGLTDSAKMLSSYPHIQGRVGNFQLRLHFQFIESTRSIMILLLCAKAQSAIRLLQSRS